MKLACGALPVRLGTRLGTIYRLILRAAAHLSTSSCQLERVRSRREGPTMRVRVPGDTRVVAAATSIIRDHVVENTREPRYTRTGRAGAAYRSLRSSWCVYAGARLG